jgi:hypothetical protein
MSWFDRLFGKKNGAGRAPRDGGIYVYVRCFACEEVVRARINPSSDLSQGDDGTFFVRKVLVGQKCFRPIEVKLSYADRGGGTEVDREIRGGTFVDASAMNDQET